MSRALAVDRIACTGHGLCAELLPELISLDEWGYPIVDRRPVPSALTGHARRAVAACPALALRLADTGPAQPGGSGSGFRRPARS